MKKRIISFAANILLLIFSLCLVVVLAELILPFLKIRTIEEAVYQARRPVVQGIYGQYNRQLHYTLQKNLREAHLYYPGQLDYTVSTNSQGFRGPEWDLSPRRKNVVVLGDSFAFGWGVQWEQTIGIILEKELQKKDPSYQVINLAMPGWDIDVIIRSLEIFNDSLKPVAVIYVFCPNDLLAQIKKISADEYDLSYQPGPDDEKNFQAMVARQQPDYRSWNKFYRSSYGKAFHARVFRPFFSKRIRSSLAADTPPAGFSFPQPMERPEKATLDNEHQEFFLYCLNRLVKSAAAPLFIIDTSDKSILFKKDMPDNRRWVLYDFAEKNKGRVTYVDFESFVRQTPDGRKFYLDYDDHWSVPGHIAAANLLRDKMALKLQFANKVK